MLIEVVTTGDVLRHERQTRALYMALKDLDEVQVDFAPQEPARADGHKGGVVDLALVAAVGVASRPAVQLLITTIKEWCATERHKKVVLKDGERSVEIDGSPDAAQERMIRQFLDGERQ
ncbi:hypothetical protein ACIBG8_40045 [Nonomuraea sp. NPDC050556]|uniref:effector-associated constant component EACC1 n=1 Tax=Nonomuraea sp. NPDC050556 TaxID=3364369 RepID=UPI0037912FDE